MILTRQERERQAMTEEIIGLALAMVRTEGAANLSLRRIAQQMEYSSAALYRYVADKAAVVALVRQHGFHELAARLRAAASDRPIPEQLVALGQAYVQFAVDEPNLYTLMFVNLLPDPPSPRTPPSAAASGTPPPLQADMLVHDVAFAVLHTTVVTGARSGVLQLSETELLPTSVALWALVHGQSMLLISAPGLLTDAMIHVGLQTMVAGLLAGQLRQ